MFQGLVCRHVLIYASVSIDTAARQRLASILIQTLHHSICLHCILAATQLSFTLPAAAYVHVNNTTKTSSYEYFCVPFAGPQDAGRLPTDHSAANAEHHAEHKVWRPVSEDCGIQVRQS